LLQIGIATIWQRVRMLTDYLCEQAQARGWHVFSSRQPGEESGIVSLIHPSLPAREVVSRCRAAGVVVNHRAERVRLSPHAYNTQDELDRFFAATR
jgi:selenocysteine lyase/cysteine desulfurase